MELGNLAQSFTLILIGAVSASLAVLYWSASGLTLLSFGLFALLTGMQQLLSIEAVASSISNSATALAYVAPAISYWLPLPGLIFFEQILGSGWWSPFRRIWQGWSVLAVGCVLFDLARGPGAALGVQLTGVVIVVIVLLGRVMVWGVPRTTERLAITFGVAVYMAAGLHDILLSFGLFPWPIVLSDDGVRVFVLSLGYVTTRRFFSAQRDLATMEYEMKTASAIQASILPRGVPSVSGLEIAVRYVPMRSIAGDIYDFVTRGQRMGVLVADVTGHGVSAALIASMAKIAFTSQTDAVNRPGDLLAGMNRALCGQFEGKYVTATFVSFDLAARSVCCSNAGHPPPLVWQPGPGQIVELTGGGVFLGFDPAATYSVGEMPIGRGDRVVVYTDGLIEATNPRGEFFGIEGLMSFIETNCTMPAEEFAESLLSHLRHWSGRRTGESAFEDDVTLVVVDVTV